ncbi:hypothetical protein SAMN05216312_103404 [Cohnella sp. OV330]|uniref:hypothetical protein n=1 Tax=Cohnella sp. OV330 TaxID=1855288 RepID=UPI0008DF2F0F|nr:hypothetical protein [Cohnella sp. OV330]SFB08312.1 hypothetical protein SAMN05216312_103404 [Cohnella sp. OV330]
MKKYNFVRPVLLIVTALLVRSIVTNACLLLGMEAEPASSVGFMAMIVAAFIIFSRMNKRRRKPSDK